MNTVILAAGQSRRFKEGGWPKHKMLLPAPNHKTILEMLVDRLGQKSLDIIVLEENRREITPTLFRVAKQMNFELNVHWLRSNPQGPLDTIWEARYITGGQLLVSYCDIMPAVDMAKLYVQTARDLKWNAAVVGADNPAKRMTRVPKTSLADAGLYYFRSTKQFFKLVKKIRRGPEDGIQKAVYAHEDWHCYHSNYIKDLGVPIDYKYWAGENGMTQEDIGF